MASTKLAVGSEFSAKSSTNLRGRTTLAQRLLWINPRPYDGIFEATFIYLFFNADRSDLVVTLRINPASGFSRWPFCHEKAMARSH